MLVASSFETIHLCMALFPTGGNSSLPASVRSDFQKTSIEVEKIFTSKAIYRRHKFGLFTQHQWHPEYVVRRKQNHQSDAHYETKMNMYTGI